MMNRPHSRVLKRWKTQKLKREGSFCCHCFIDLTPETATFDHVIPQACGGKWSYPNLRMACKACNEERGKTDFDQYNTAKLFQLSKAIELLAA